MPLMGKNVVLRARTAADLEVLVPEMFDDPEYHTLSSDDPWVPRSPEWHRAAHDRRTGSGDDPAAASAVTFTVASRNDPAQVLGSCSLWGIDTLSRGAHLGLGLVPGARGRGLGGETVALLCEYGFRGRALHRLQIETLDGNTAMRRAALANGFREEGRQREAAWTGDGFADMVVFGLLDEEWRAGRAPERS